MILASFVRIEDIAPVLDKYNSKIELSNYDQTYLNSIAIEEDRKRVLISRIVLDLLIKKIGKKNLTVRLMSYSSHGKPLLPGLEVSISHSAQYVAVAISKTEKIGIDIQKHENIDFKEYESFLTKDQVRRMDELNVVDKKEFFYDIWSKKEAIMKADGRGMELHPGHIILKDDHAYVKNSNTKWYNLPCPEIKNYSLALYSNSTINELKWFGFVDDNLNEVKM